MRTLTRPFVSSIAAWAMLLAARAAAAQEPAGKPAPPGDVADAPAPVQGTPPRDTPVEPPPSPSSSSPTSSPPVPSPVVTPATPYASASAGARVPPDEELPQTFSPFNVRLVAEAGFFGVLSNEAAFGDAATTIDFRKASGQDNLQTYTRWSAELDLGRARRASRPRPADAGASTIAMSGLGAERCNRRRRRDRPSGVAAHRGPTTARTCTRAAGTRGGWRACRPPPGSRGGGQRGAHREGRRPSRRPRAFARQRGISIRRHRR